MLEISQRARVFVRMGNKRKATTLKTDISYNFSYAVQRYAVPLLPSNQERKIATDLQKN